MKFVAHLVSLSHFMRPSRQSPLPHPLATVCSLCRPPSAEQQQQAREDEVGFEAVARMISSQPDRRVYTVDPMTETGIK